MINFLTLLHPHWVFRDSTTGRFCTRLYALTHPTTTYGHKVK